MQFLTVFRDEVPAPTAGDSDASSWASENCNGGYDSTPSSDSERRENVGLVSSSESNAADNVCAANESDIDNLPDDNSEP